MQMKEKGKKQEGKEICIIIDGRSFASHLLWLVAALIFSHIYIYVFKEKRIPLHLT